MVILGRGGQAILKDKPDVLHVRIEATLDARVRWVQRRDMTGMVPEFQQRAAQERVKERDRVAAGYLRRFYDIDWEDPGLYHLAIDTDEWRIEAAAGLIASAVGCLPWPDCQSREALLDSEGVYGIAR